MADKESRPPDEPMTGRQKLRLVGLVILKRLRFIAILAAVGLFIGYWDTVMNYWEKWTQPRGVSARALEPGYEFYCPMDPQVIRSTYEPNGDVPKCPICGMPLSIRKKGEAARLPEGITGRVQFSPERIQLAGIKTETVQYRAVAKQTKTVGYIAYDERRLSRIVSRVDGYVEKLYVNETFEVVHKGDPLAEIYSPELFSTAQELILATRGREKGISPISRNGPEGAAQKLDLSPFPARGGGVGDLAAAARNKLLLLGVGRQEIDGIVASGKPSLRLVIRSPQTGYVVDKKIVVGASVDAKMTLFEVADLSTVWVEADVYEKDIPFLQVGQKVEATVEASPNRRFTGKLALIYPQMEAATRTNRIRFELNNSQHALRPGMFATVRINTPLEGIEPYKSMAAKAGRVVLTGLSGKKGISPISRNGPEGASQKLDLSPFSSENGPPQYEFLCVPERAVIDTGSKKVVYVEREPGMFEGVEVQLGPRQDEYYPVIKGLKAGDKIAAAGGFLIDAETRLNPAAASTYFGASGGPQSSDRPATPPASSRHQGDQAPDDENIKNIEQLPEADRKVALAQGSCPVTGAALGSMGVPVKITLRGQTVFLCCKACIAKAKKNPDEMLKKLKDAKRATKRKQSTEPRTVSTTDERGSP
jgi:Cu(I)/Ag(I) efflux system membrane fusion protein